LIFIILGTQDKQFTRLLEAVDKQIQLGNITDNVVVQSGCTKFKSKNMQMFDLVSQENFSQYIEEADIVITHGGVGSILTALKKGKKIIAVPRLSKFGEHINDHQLQIIKVFNEKGYLLPLEDLSKLGETLKMVKTFVPNSFGSKNTRFIQFLEKSIENL